MYDATIGYEIYFTPVNDSAYAVSPPVPPGCPLPPYVCAYEGRIRYPDQDEPYDGLFFDCPDGFTFSGSVDFMRGSLYTHEAFLQQCSGSGQWLYPVPQCIQPSFSACHTVTVSSAQVAECAANEIVVAGAPSCSPAANVSSSEPTAALNSWTAGCSDGSLPASISINCCPAATDTFLISQPYDPSSTPTGADPATQTPLAFTSGLLPAGSSFQGCEYSSSAPLLQPADGAYTACPQGKVTVAGGGTCFSGDAIAISTPINSADTGLGDSWSTGCQSLSPAVHIAAICCYALGGLESSSITAGDTGGSCEQGKLLLARPQVCASSSLSLTLSGFSQAVASTTPACSAASLAKTNDLQLQSGSYFCVNAEVGSAIDGQTVGLPAVRAGRRRGHCRSVLQAADLARAVPGVHHGLAELS